MASWQKYLKDFEITEWNEQNFDLNENKFIQQAYAQKKWAYVSDYMRVKVVNEQGDIYLDTDVMVLRDLSPYLNDCAFVGFESKYYPYTATFGSEPQHLLTQAMVAYYQNRDFVFEPDNHEQLIKAGIHVYPDRIFCIPSLRGATVHTLNGSWVHGKNH